MRKYQSVESIELPTKEEQEEISKNLHALGKTSAKELTDEERASALDTQRVN